jgi:hypothetical protein
MSGRRLFGVIAVLVAAGGLAAAPANAARPASGPLTAYPETLTTDHFQVHYTGAIATPANPDRITQQVAGDLAAGAERAYDLFVTTWGYPAPRSDGDGRVDIWVQKQPDGGAPAVITADTTAPTSVWVSVSPAKAADAHTSAWAVMSAVEAGMWVPSDLWLIYATSEWAAFAATDYFEAAGTLGKPDLSLDCESQSCGDLAYEIAGPSRWGFFQYLAERFGNTLVKDAFAAGAAAADPARKGADLLARALAGKGTTLGAAFNDYTAVHAAGAYGVTVLKGVAPTTHTTVQLTTTTSTLPVVRLGVNHLAARYVKLARDVSNTGQCYAATLSLTVTLPTGSTSLPSLYSSTLGSTARPFTVSGRTASLSVPWTTCPTGGDAYLAVPNPSLTADGQNFVVNGTLTVGSVAVTQPSLPPPASYTGPFVAAPTTDAAPTIVVFGSELLHVPAATRLLRLIVRSSAAGLLRASIAGADLGTISLRAGSNDIRLTLPVAAPGTLTLTVLAPDATAAGETLTRTIAITQPAKKKATASKTSVKKSAKSARR